jgi:hypothetical protein
MMIPTTPINEALSVDPLTGRPLNLPADPPGTPSPSPYAYDLFPATLPLALATTDDFVDDVRIDRAVDGTGRARSFYSVTKTHISARLSSLTQTELNQFLGFYSTHRSVQFLLPWPPCGGSTTLPVMFATPPRFAHDGNHLHTVTFDLVEFP